MLAAAEIERDLSTRLVLDHDSAGVRRATFFLTPMLVFLVTGRNSHPRVVVVKELSIRRQLKQMSVDRKTRIRYLLGSFKLDGLRKGHAATLLHSRLSVKRHSARIFVERDGDVGSLVKLLILFDAFRKIGGISFETIRTAQHRPLVFRRGDQRLARQIDLHIRLL